MLYNWYYKVSQHKCHNQKPLQQWKFLLHWLLTHHFQWFWDPWRGFEENICMTKILDEQQEYKKQKYTGLELKHIKKGFIENFHCLLNTKKYEKITVYFISSPTFMSTSNIIINGALIWFLAYKGWCWLEGALKRAGSLILLYVKFPKKTSF